jgi:hypothetical protein
MMAVNVMARGVERNVISPMFSTGDARSLETLQLSGGGSLSDRVLMFWTRFGKHARRRPTRPSVPEPNDDAVDFRRAGCRGEVSWGGGIWTTLSPCTIITYRLLLYRPGIVFRSILPVLPILLSELYDIISRATQPFRSLPAALPASALLLHYTCITSQIRYHGLISFSHLLLLLHSSCAPPLDVSPSLPNHHHRIQLYPVPLGAAHPKPVLPPSHLQLQLYHPYSKKAT